MKNLSIFSTVLMAVYTIFLILADLRLFSVSAAFGHMSKSVTGWIIDGADLSVIAGTLSVSVSVLILIFAVVFLFFCIACVILTVLSYWLIRRKKYKADAWMKIVVFGFALAGCIKLVSFWVSILLILPVVLNAHLGRGVHVAPGGIVKASAEVADFGKVDSGEIVRSPWENQ